MIHSFKFKNFCSFAEEATINFVDIRKGMSVKNNMFCDSPAGANLSKVTTVVGSNASGKTSALKALSFLAWFACYSFVGLEGEKEAIPLDTFAFSDEQNGIAEFEIVFEQNSKIYKYVLHLCKTNVVQESLFEKDKKTNHFNYLFKRRWNPELEEPVVIHRINLRSEVMKDILRKNVSLIAAGVAIKNEVLTGISSFFDGIISNVNRTGKSWDTSSVNEDGLFDAAEFYGKNPELFEKVVEFLKDVDLGIEDVIVKEVEAQHSKTGEMKKVYFPWGIHKVDGKPYMLPFAFESSGTRNMFVLLRKLFPAIERGGVAVIDELEIDLHPHMLPCIVGLFADSAVNSKNTQLLFTSHSLDILSHLEKEQVILVEKNENCKSELYRLDEIKGVRRDDNIYAKYMAGAYGAVPNI